MKDGLSRVGQCVGVGLVLVGFVIWAASAADAQESRKTVGIMPLVSNVADIPADAATELFINALMETNRFAIKPPDAKGAFAGVDYVLEASVSEGKAKSNVLGFLKDVATSNTPVSLTVRVFDPQASTLVNSVTVKSSDIKTAKVSAGDVQALMGAFNAVKGESEGKATAQAQPASGAQVDERLGGVMQQAVARLISQLGLGSATGGIRPSPLTPLTR